MKTAIIVAALMACSAVAMPGLGGTLGGVVGGVGSLVPEVVPTVTGISGATVQLLNNLDQTTRDNTIRTATLVSKLFNGQLSFDTIYAYLLNGVVLGTGNSATTNSIGGMSLPTETLCQFKLQYQLSSCVICNQDCYVAHNLWGGGCGTSPITGNQTCLCAESQAEADQKGITTESASCQAYNPASEAENYAIAIAFRLRSVLLQCIEKDDGTFNETGCNIDCTQNHGFASGSCEYQVPNVPLKAGIYGLTEEANKKSLPFCVCSHDKSPNTTFNAPPPARAPATLL